MLLKVRFDGSRPQYFVPTEVERNTTWRQSVALKRTNDVMLQAQEMYHYLSSMSSEIERILLLLKCNF